MAELRTYQGECHCGALAFQFTGAAITRAVRCNCSLCRRKGVLMSPYAIAPEDLYIDDPDSRLQSYRFGSEVACHYFCGCCGVNVFHQTLSKPGHYRVNLGCIDGLNAASATDCLSLPVDIIDGAAL